MHAQGSSVKLYTEHSEKNILVLIKGLSRMCKDSSHEQRLDPLSKRTEFLPYEIYI